MIYDIFMYHNETDVLRMRFEELSERVNYFVAVEGSHTFTGLEKPLYFDDLPEWADNWKPRVIRLAARLDKSNASAWEREICQRNAAMDFIKELDADDIVILSDADEIPRSSLVVEKDSPVQFDVTQYFWNLNWRVPSHCNTGARPVIAKASQVTSPQELRSAQLPRIPYGGWHFSFLGNQNAIKTKIESFAHTEYNKDEYKSSIEVLRRIREGIDPFDRFPLKYNSVDATYPIWVQENIDKLSHLIQLL